VTSENGEGIRSGPTLLQGWRAWAAVGTVVLLAAAVRLPLVLGSDFPVHDGGLFASAITDILDAGGALPRTLSYNRDGIPFVYPPLWFYVAAAVVALGRVDVLGVLRVLPALLSIATVPAVYLLGLRLQRERMPALLAALVFVLIPGSEKWLVMGGGLTRAGGLLLGLLALAAADRGLSGGGRRWLVAAGVLVGLTVLSHPEVAIQTGLVLVLLALLRYRSRAGLRRLGVVVAVAGVTAAPWLLTVLVRHGLAPFLTASGATRIHADATLGGLLLGFTAEATVPLFALLALVGAGVEVVGRRPLVPLWLLGVVVLLPRSAFTWGSVPAAMLVAVALERGLGRAVAALGGGRTVVRGAVGTAVALLLAHGAVELHWAATSSRVLSPIPADDVAAMRWIAEETPPSATFVLLEAAPFEEDAVGEWFPAVARRRDPLVLQGTEWLPGVYRRRYGQRIEAWSALEAGPAALGSWLDDAGDVTHLLAPTRSSGDPAVRTAVSGLVRSGGWRVVYARSGSVVLARVGRGQ
jgi:4-amino-4-deoxy-L-arabinose transferase-like glycosyltransferase